VQFNVGPSRGGYVSTIGAARATGGAAGTATLIYEGLHTGAHNITVQYGGDSNFIGSTSTTSSITATKEDPKVVLGASPVGTSVYGTTVTLKATLSDQDNDDDWIPTGTVTFYDGVTAIGTATLNNGTASISVNGTASLTGGSHELTVQYSGDEDFNAGTSSAVAYTVTKANSASTITQTVTSSKNPAIFGDSVTLTYQLTSSVGVTPIGTLTVVDGSATLGTITLSNGTATVTVPVFTAGTHSIVATYSGDGNYN
jgi:hypothetical protein